MRRSMTPAAIALAALVLACVRAPEAAAPAFDPVAGLAHVRTVRAALAAQWDRLDALRREEAALAGKPRLTPSEAARSRQLTETLPMAEAAVQSAYGSDQAALAEFLNAGLDSRPGSAETLAALQLYAEGAERYAADAIALGGDYRLAVEVLQTACAYFADAHVPPPQQLLTALHGAREYRVVTRARFARLARGLSEAEVKALLGVPYSGNVHHSLVAGDRVTSWLYGSEDGSVAAVYFDDRSTLYAWRWNLMGSR